LVESFSCCYFVVLLLKAIFVIIVSVIITGYVMYSGLLPVDFQNPVKVLSPIPEKIQQISNAIVSHENKTIYYSFEDVPSVPDKQIPVNALKKAIQTWKANNSNLKFVQSENSNIEIKWQAYAASTHTGLATCNSVLYGILSHCVLDISIGAEDCNGNFVQNDENMVSNILMHEIGHVLGLGHTSESGHLMYSTESPQIFFDTKGYVIPDRLNELYVGQSALIQQEKELRVEIDSLDVKISGEQSQYDEYRKQYEYYEGKILSTDEYRKAQKAFDKLNSQTEKVNEIIDQQNELIKRLNDIINDLGCNPNFDVVS